MLCLKRLAPLLALILFTAELSAHGGVWRPPGSGGNGQGGRYKGPGDIVPKRPVTPTGTPSPTAPTTPSAPTPSAPKAPAPLSPPSAPLATTPLSGGAAMAAPAASPGTPGGELPPDTAGWETWWDYNRDRYLALRRDPYAGRAITPSGDSRLGPDPDARSRYAREVRETAVEMLGDETASTDRLTAALIAFARTGRHPSLAQEMEAFLAHRNQEVVETTVLGLGLLRAPHLFGELKRMLDADPEAARVFARSRIPERTREFAAYSIALSVRNARLESFKLDAAQALLDVAHDLGERADLAAACLIALAQIPLKDPQSALKRLVPLLEDAGHADAVRAHVPTAAARLLRAAAESRTSRPLDPAVEIARQNWLRRLRHHARAREESSLVRHACVQALGWLPVNDDEEPQLVQQIIEIGREDADSLVRHQCLISLAMIGRWNRTATQTQILPWLLEKLDRGGFHTRGWAALALGVLSFEARAEGQDLPTLVARRVHEQFQEENSPSVRSACAIALGLMRHEAAAEDLLAALQERKNPDLQGQVAIGLGLLGHRSAMKPLRDLLGKASRKPELLRATGEALALLQDPEAVQQVLRLLGKRHERRMATTAAVAQALAAMRSPAALKPLKELVEDARGQELARALAMAAMGLIGDPERLPFRAEFARALNYRTAPATLVDPGGMTGLLNLL